MTTSRRQHLLPSLAPFATPATLVSLSLFIIPMIFVASYTVGEDRGLWEGVLEIAGSVLVFKVFLNTVYISLTSAVVSVLMAYPVAFHLMRQTRMWKAVCLTLVLVPFWTSILVKSYAFIVILGERGVINTVLRAAGFDGFDMMFNRFAVIVGMSNALIPFAIFPILASLSAQNQTIQAAGEVMGASSWRIFWSITFPQSLPGVLASFLLCLVLSMGFFVTPALLGGRQDMMMANIIDLYTREVLDWQSASIIALLLLLFCGLLAGVVLKLQQRVGR
ncbi:ABC transporter permease [Falsochrobactrum sp. TDYN1]|uniref:ABC transporter permease n=1 Tax=Falsochrobactrum tianjinense TaxID=2706015 RepID=A0A949UVQ8_9HYPH|nr:ABC transporter permease [Falsochrobactrum sp. TDYN1]MBV2145107.1 ABC transporter permease [Falsochrobactrum sp. TDYN1]